MEINTKYKIKSEVSNALSVMHPNMTIFVYTKSPKQDYVHISGRRQDYQVNVAETIEMAIEGMTGASGGGHKPAAACTILKKDLPEFKRKVLEILSK